MIAKSLVAAAALVGTLAVAAPLPAEAKTNLNIHIGLGVGGYYPGYYGYGDPGYYPVYSPGHISCKKGRRIVDGSGFNNVHPVDCSLPRYRYSAWRHGHKFVVTVNRFGNISNVNRLF